MSDHEDIIREYKALAEAARLGPKIEETPEQRAARHEAKRRTFWDIYSGARPQIRGSVTGRFRVNNPPLTFEPRRQPSAFQAPYEAVKKAIDSMPERFTYGDIPVVISPELPIYPDHKTDARRIVRHGMADVLEWLGEKVGPKPGEPTVMLFVNDPLGGGAKVVVGHETYRTLKEASQGAVWMPPWMGGRR